MKMKFIVSTDHDNTLNEKFSIPVAVKHNSSIDSKKFSRLKQTLFSGVKEETIRTYLQKKGMKDLETPLQLSSFVSFCYITKEMDRHLGLQLASEMMHGITKSDMDKAGKEIIEGISKGAREYFDFIKKEGGYNIILSDGVYQLVEVVAKEIGNIDFITGQKLFFENGVFNGKVELINKWDVAYKIYKRKELPLKDGIYQRTVIVDDLALNLDEMKKHDLPIAFCPNEEDEKLFAKEGLKVKIVRERDFSKVASWIQTYLQYANVVYTY
jgi:phosphoserine phosphatase